MGVVNGEEFLALLPTPSKQIYEMDHDMQTSGEYNMLCLFRR